MTIASQLKRKQKFALYTFARSMSRIYMKIKKFKHQKEIKPN